MRARSRLLRAPLVVLTMLAGFLLGSGLAQALTPEELRVVTDDYIFNRSLSEFGMIRSQQPHADQLDWSSDGCSASPDDPFGFTFLPACQRHDFGYRNYRLQGRFTEDNRLALDNKFRSDMYGICGWNWWCRRTADVYYWAVREFGGISFSTVEAVESAKSYGLDLKRQVADALVNASG
jgi:phospholipase A2-like protein